MVGPSLGQNPSAGGPEAEQLEALNARLRGRRDASELIRRNLENQIEAKARRIRRQQAAASASWKR